MEVAHKHLGHFHGIDTIIDEVLVQLEDAIGIAESRPVSISRISRSVMTRKGWISTSRSPRGGL